MPLAKNGKSVFFIEKRQILHLTGHCIKSGETAKLSVHVLEADTVGIVYKEPKRSSLQ